MSRAGSLVCVGTGMTLGSHLTPLARSYIESSDVVFAAMSDGLTELWLTGLHRDVRSLQHLYRKGRSRLETYRRMVESLMGEVRSGQRVCGAFYGHPGVFAWPSHKAIETARREGFLAHMEPGISAADCLYAELGIDPGRFGCQHFESTQFMLYRRVIDPASYLVLWQVGTAGDSSLARFGTTDAYRQVLVDILARDYDLDHEVIAYRAATLPTQRSRIDRMRLRDLPRASTDMQVTLIVPPARALRRDEEVGRRLAALDAACANEG
jgi:precorrin-3B methylase